MKNLIYTALIAVFALGTITSCEKDVILDEEIEIADDASFARGSVTQKNSTAFETIDDLRAAGIRVSRSLQNAVNNNVQTLLDAAALSTTRNGRRTLRRRGFGRRLINQLRRIAAELENLETEEPTPDPVPDPTPDPTPDPVPTDPGVILQIADLNLSADAQRILSFGSAEVGSGRDAIDRTVTSVSTNSIGLFSLANDGRIINQNGRLRTRNQFEQDILDGFRRRFGSTARNSVPNFNATLEEFRPLAANATDNLLALLNNE